MRRSIRLTLMTAAACGAAGGLLLIWRTRGTSRSRA